MSVLPRRRAVGPAWSVLVLALAAAGCAQGEPEPEPPASFAPDLGVQLSEMRRTPSGLYLQVLREGAGDPAQSGERISVHYTGWLVDGVPFDSSFARSPFNVTLGETYMVEGFMEGIGGMKLGEERLLVVKPDLGYERTLVPGVPRDSWLVFRVERVPTEPRSR